MRDAVTTTAKKYSDLVPLPVRVDALVDELEELYAHAACYSADVLRGLESLRNGAKRIARELER